MPTKRTSKDEADVARAKLAELGITHADVADAVAWARKRAAMDEAAAGSLAVEETRSHRARAGCAGNDDAAA